MMRRQFRPIRFMGNPYLGALHRIGRHLKHLIATWPSRRGNLDAPLSQRSARLGLASVLVALLAACQTTPNVSSTPGGLSHLPPGNSQRDGPDAHPPKDLESVPDAVPQIEPVRPGGPNKPYEIGGHTYVPLTDDRPITEKGLASWYGKKFHGHRTSSGEAYNMYAMTAAHKTLPIPSYARVRNPANGREVIVRVNDRGPFSSGRIIDLSYTAALKLGVLGGVQPVEISRITEEDIRTGAAFRQGSTYAANVPGGTSTAAKMLPPAANDVVAALGPGVDLGSAAASDLAPPIPAAASQAAGDAAIAGDAPSATMISPVTSSGVLPLSFAAPLPVSPARADSGSTLRGETVGSARATGLASAQLAPAEARDEHARADTTAGAGWWLQLGAYRQRDGALEFQRRLIDEQPWLAPLLAVFSDRGLNKLQAGPYTSRNDAKSAAEHIRTALQLVPTLVEKR
jgi:rare lipoprotein A